MNCPNCNAKLSCGCQRRTASDGKQVCSSCSPAYEQKLVEQKKQNPNVQNSNKPS
jgi:hypothetical protein